MAKNNNTFPVKPYLDVQVDKYADYVYATFEYDRINGRMKSFGDFYYPAMVSVCTDICNQFLSEGFADSPKADEYGKTSLLWRRIGLNIRLYNNSVCLRKNMAVQADRRIMVLNG